MLKLFPLLVIIGITTSLLSQTIKIGTLAAEASKNGKHLFIWLHKTGCGYCEAMQEFTLEEEHIKALVARAFTFVPVNVYEDDTVVYKDFNGSAKAFAVELGYNFYPSSLFFDKDADLVFAAPGYVEEDDFMNILRYIADDAYQTMSYDAFRRKGRR